MIVISFLGSVGYLFYRRVQIKAEKWGVTRQTHEGLGFKYLQEGFGAIKDIKILQRSNELIKNYTANNKIINLSEFKQSFIDTLPRLWLEWLVVIGFVLLILLMFFLGKELSYIVPLLGLFAAASFRIMPSLTRIMNAVQGILYNRTVVDSVYKEFNKKNFQNAINKTFSKKILLKKEIILKNVNFKYSESGSFILENINLRDKNDSEREINPLTKDNDAIDEYLKSGAKRYEIKTLSGILGDKNNSKCLSKIKIKKKSWKK